MTKSQLGLLGSVLAAGALAVVGCGGGGGGGGTGGKADGGTGGKGTGGMSSVGGSTGTGGKMDAGSAGTTGTDSGTDVTTDGGTGGAAVDGGVGGADGGGSDSLADASPADTGTDTGPASPLIPIGIFNADLDGFSLLFVTDTLKPDGGAQPTAEFDGTIGRPNPGSSKLTIPFVPMPTVPPASYIDEHVEWGKNFTPTDMTGRIITARVMLDAVDGGASPGIQAFFVLKTATAADPNAFVYANGAFTGLSAGNWVTVIMLADSPGFASTGFDPSRVRQVAVGIQGNTNDTGLTTASIHIDSVGYQ